MEGNTTLSLNIISIYNQTNLSTSSTFTVNNNDEQFWFPGKDSPYTFGAAIVISLVLFIIIVGTIVGNILVCVAVCIVRKLRRPYNYLLVSLAVSDICVAILVMPMATLTEILGSWNLGPVLCDLWVSFDVLSCTASILNLCMISVDRYYAITKPLEYGVKRTPKRMILCIALVWLGAACISLPPLLILGNEHETKNEDGTVTTNVCVVCQNFGYQIYATLGSFYIPLTVMIVVYYKIFRAARRIVLEERQARTHLETHCYLEVDKNGSGPPEAKVTQTGGKGHRASTSSTNTTCSGQTSLSTRCFPPRHSNESQFSMCNRKDKTNKKTRSFISRTRKKSSATTANLIGPSPSQKKLRFQLAKERKASTTLGIIMSAFTICWLPFFVLALVRPFLGSQSQIPTSLSSLFLWLGYANSLLNPIIYATLNRDFRKPFQQILYFRCGSLNHMMREEFYHSHYGDPDHHYSVINNTNVANIDIRPNNNVEDEEEQDGEDDVELNRTVAPPTATNNHESFL